MLDNETFALVLSHFEQQRFQHWVSTDPKAIKERDAIYNQMRATQDFLGHLKAYVVQKDEIEKRSALSEEDEDAPMEISD